MRLADSLRGQLARRLERGEASSAARAAAALWGALSARGLARPLALPPGVQVVGVGSAVLGGAGKTPLSIALARSLAGRGARVGLLGHAYRARPGRARVVQATDHLAEVGDDALTCARDLVRRLHRAVDVAIAVLSEPGGDLVEEALVHSPERIRSARGSRARSSAGARAPGCGSVSKRWASSRCSTRSR